MEKLVAEADLNRTLGTLRYLEGLRAARQKSLAAPSPAEIAGTCHALVIMSGWKEALPDWTSLLDLTLALWNGPSMADFARTNLWQGGTKYWLKEQNAGRTLAGPLAVPVPRSQPRGVCQGYPALKPGKSPVPTAIREFLLVCQKITIMPHPLHSEQPVGKLLEQGSSCSCANA